VSGLYLESRLDFLRSSQNPDGGWGYFPGKRSWMEPTAYAMLALQGSKDSAVLLDRAWLLTRSWQLSDGSVKPSAEVQDGTWVTSLAITVACVRGIADPAVTRSVDWLLGLAGQEHNWMMRGASNLHLLKTKLDVSHEGWPWRAGNASWIEPTAQALVALKKVAPSYHNPELAHRVREGEELLLARRCSDGGWNCGNPNVLNFDLPSYPETTALALMGLVGRSAAELTGPLAVARKWRQETKSSLAKAWLSIALRCHGERLAAPPDDRKPSNDIMLAALEALGHPEGGYRLLISEGRA
jgi:hypothetical protein